MRRYHDEVCPTCHGRGFLPPERECASETCENRFRWQGSPDRTAKSARVDAIYCSNRCAKAQAQREYRRRLRSG